MAYGLNINQLPEYCYSGFKTFVSGEKHITRICEEDVLIMMFDGELYFNEDGKSVEVMNGQYYIQKAGLLQEGLIASDNARYYYIHFHGNFCDDTSTLPLSGNSSLLENFEGFRTLELLQHTAASRVEKSAEFFWILSKLKAEGEISRNRKCVLKVISWITEDYEKIYTLEELATRCGYSKNHFIRIFKEETWLTPFSYILNLRINAAKTLLANSDRPIAEISQKCGFGSYINFYKAFTRREGITPEQWRRVNRGV